MSPNVVDLDSRRPHIEGKARCLSCKHEWTAVAPTKITWLECPACRTNLGRMVEHCEIEDVPHWHCDCGNDLFYCVSDGAYCPVCGARVEWKD